MPRPLTPDEHYDNERARIKARADARRDAAEDRARERSRQTNQKILGCALIVGGIMALGLCAGVLKMAGLLPERATADTGNGNARTVTDPAMRVKADDLESAYLLRKDEASSRYDGKTYLIHFPSLAAMDEDSAGTPCVLHWNDKGFKCPAIVVRLKNRTSYAKSEQITKSVYVEGKIVGLQEAASLPWMKKWADLAPSHMVPKGFVIVVEEGSIVPPPK